MNKKLQPNVASSFLDVLNSLNCPYTQDVDDSYISELLLSPGEHRVRLLMWIFGEIHPDLDKMMNLPKALTPAPSDLCIDQRIQILTGLAAAFGLCRTADFELIRGQAPLAKQSSFWKKLFALAEHSAKSYVDNAFQADKNLMHDITSKSGDVLHHCFSERVDLLPHDFMLEFSKTKVSQKKVTKESFSEIETELVKLQEKLTAQENMLRELEASLKYLQKDDAVACENVSRCLALTLNDLDQMLTAFDQVFENSFAPFCNRESVAFGSLGPSIQIVRKQLSYIVNTFDNLESIKISTNAVINCTKKWSKTRKKMTQLVSVFEDFWNNSLQCLDNFNHAMTATTEQDVSTFESQHESMSVSQGLETKLSRTLHDMSMIK